MTLPKGFGMRGYEPQTRYLPRPTPVKKEKVYPTGECKKCGHTKNAHKTKFGLIKTHCISCMCPKYNEKYVVDHDFAKWRKIKKS